MLPRIISKFQSDERGETAIEYGLIAALISVSIITAATEFSDSLSLMLTSAANIMTTAAN